MIFNDAKNIFILKYIKNIFIIKYLLSPGIFFYIAKAKNSYGILSSLGEFKKKIRLLREQKL